MRRHLKTVAAQRTSLVALRVTCALLACVAACAECLSIQPSPQGQKGAHSGAYQLAPEQVQARQTTSNPPQPPPALMTTQAEKFYDGGGTQPKPTQAAGQEAGAKLRSSTSDELADDSLPLATINNHHSKSAAVAAIRPPHYVDVAALVGGRADRLNMSGYLAPGASSAGGQQPQSPLSPKSRSGLPECATQQVCNAIFVRMNYTQKLCECSSNYNWKCSHELNPQDGHTIELTRKFDKRIYTQIKTCEPLREVRACKSPTDWTLLALQSERSGKAHYVVVCKCPTWAQLEGPYTHNHPPYANIPGIRVYGMLCAHQTARSSAAQSYASYNPGLSIFPEFPWQEAMNVLNTTSSVLALDSPH